MISRTRTTAIIAFIILSTFTAIYTISTHFLALEKGKSKEQVWKDIQEWRIQNGLRPYSERDDVCRFANERLKAVTLNFSHDGFIEKANLEFPKANVSENLMFVGLINRNKDPLQSWLNSPSHRKNLEKDEPYGCLAANDRTYVHIMVSD